jgi:hypothetical protein
MKLLRPATAIVGAVVGSAYLQNVHALSPSVTLPGGQGQVVGQCDAGQCVFRGIPFAEDTGGANRFLPPVKRAPWAAPFNATTDGTGCISIHHNPDTAKVQGEDCLNLNVFTPASANASSKLPVCVCCARRRPSRHYCCHTIRPSFRPSLLPREVVVVPHRVSVVTQQSPPPHRMRSPYRPCVRVAGRYMFLYGGSFTEGYNSGPFDIYAGTGFTRNNVIFVAPNYRLGAFGYVVTDKVHGNMGLLDQRLAMQWIHVRARCRDHSM